MREHPPRWARLAPRARIGLVLGVLAIVGAVALLGRFTLGTTYQPLFTDLADQDAATMVAELDRMKVPYRLEAGGHQILVPQEQVHKTRLQLAGKNLPLQGAVGFEIFNQTDFGMTEFAQKVNYQRALQGELTRTILSLDEVQGARVHLALPESTLFKRDQQRAKASVTLTLKPGRHLATDQVASIQRLVAAAAPAIDMADVTVIDQRGSTLSRGGHGAGEAGDWQLALKRQIEDHLAGKIAVVLDRAFGPGQGVATVDVLLNVDQLKVTTEEVLAARASPEAAQAGVVVRERQTVKEAPGRDDKPEATHAVTQTDTEYQTGRRVEQLVSQPGSVRRIHVGVVVPRDVAPDRQERIRQVVAMAVGLDPGRGDGIALYAVDQLAEPGRGTVAAPDARSVDAPAPHTTTEPLPAPAVSTEAPAGKTPTATPHRGSPDALATALAWLVGGVALAGGLLLLVQRARGQPVRASTPRLPADLPPAERAAMLRHVQQWLESPAVASRPHEPSASSDR